VENSPMLTSRGLGTVLGDLASIGFDARWGVLGAADVGANHQRNRIWIVGNASSIRRSEGRDDHGQDDGSKPATDGQHSSQMAYALCNGLQGIRPNGTVKGQVGLRCRTGSNQIKQLRHTASEGLSFWVNGSVGQPRSITESKRPNWWATEPNVGRVAHGVAARVDRLKAIGNGQVPLCAATAWRLLNAP
jgi:DNA (cytosine-5)-methyltransferase 1